uniref:Leucine rich repeat protein n=1 Tax=Megaviridae environmental sample TaxID=1737588 RepID=A0A5J6VKE3_9VIRU|nr:MAG: leucine rich repeat protein [Megaviridae environmental sample]
MDYKSKYLKYKNKYLDIKNNNDIKNQVGGWRDLPDSKIYSIENGHLIIKPDVKVIPFNAFGDAFGSKLDYTQLTIPEGVEEIGDYAFSAGKFDTLILPSTLRYIGTRAFYECPNLQKVAIKDGLISLAHTAVFSYCTNLEIVILPKTLRFLGPETFYECRKLTKIELPNSLESISNAAFSGTKITELTIPPSVGHIQGNIFEFKSCDDPGVKIISENFVWKDCQLVDKRFKIIKRIINPSVISQHPDMIFDERQFNRLYIINDKNTPFAFGRFKFSDIKEKTIDDFSLHFVPKVLIGPTEKSYSLMNAPDGKPLSTADKFSHVHNIISNKEKMSDILSEELATATPDIEEEVHSGRVSEQKDRYFLLMFLGEHTMLERGEQNEGIFMLKDKVLKLARVVQSKYQHPRSIMNKYPKVYTIDTDFLLSEKISADLSDYFISHYPIKLLEKYEQLFTDEEHRIILGFHKNYVNWLKGSMLMPPNNSKPFISEEIFEEKVKKILTKFVNIIKGDIKDFIQNISNQYLKYQKEFYREGYYNGDAKWDNFAIDDTSAEEKLFFLDVESSLFTFDEMDNESDRKFIIKKHYEVFRGTQIFDFVIFNQDNSESNLMNLYKFPYISSEEYGGPGFLGFDIEVEWTELRF